MGPWVFILVPGLLRVALQVLVLSYSFSLNNLGHTPTDSYIEVQEYYIATDKKEVFLDVLLLLDNLGHECTDSRTNCEKKTKHSTCGTPIAALPRKVILINFRTIF